MPFHDLFITQGFKNDKKIANRSLSVEKHLMKSQQITPAYYNSVSILSICGKENFFPNPLSNVFYPRNMNLKAIDFTGHRLNPHANEFFPNLNCKKATKNYGIFDGDSFFKFYSSVLDLFLFLCFTLFCYILSTFIYNFIFYDFSNVLSYKSVSHEKSPFSVLQNMRKKNIDRIIFGHLNINSIRNKIHTLADIVSGNIDVLLISETKIDNTFPDNQFFLNGFGKPLRFDRNVNGGGLLLYVRQDIPCKQLQSLDKQIECITAELRLGKSKWLILGIYNPNKTLIKQHLSALEKNLCHYMPNYDNLLILGDFNCEIEEITLNDFCNTFYLKCLINSPTCYKNNTNPSCIDLLLTNRPRCFQNSCTLETGLSDFHLMTLSVLKNKFKKAPPKIIRYRDFKNYDSFSFQNNVLTLFSSVNICDISFEEYNALLLNLLDNHAPMKMKFIRGNDQPFITKELRKQHMIRTRLLNNYRSCRTEDKLNAYKKQRNYCTNLLKYTKKCYYGNLNVSQICDNKKFWQTVKPLFSEKALSSHANGISLVEGENVISNDEQLTEIFNEFFSNAVKNLDISLHLTSESSNCSFPEDTDPIIIAIAKYENHPSIHKIKDKFRENDNFSFKRTDVASVCMEIEKLDLSKAECSDSLPARVLKDLNNIISPEIARYFNECIKIGNFPQNLKLADVSPIYKKKDKQCKENYRPVSVLSALSKVFERLLLYQMSEYMKNKLSIFLCGFRKGHSVQNSLLFMIEKWRKALDKSMKCGILLTDLSKAFDCIPHDLLIAKLNAYGFDHLSLKLILSYLSGRYQRVRVNASFSKWSSIIFGVPQGSILGPDLFNYDENDLFFFLILDAVNFADDNSPFSFDHTVPRVICNLENESKILLDWFKYNGLSANPDKFHLILSDKNEDLTINISDHVIKNTESQKLLGIEIDSKLTFNCHVSNLCRKASQKLHALSRVSKYMTFSQRKIIFCSFILSQFGYCPLIWMLHSRQLNNRINRIHYRALKLIYNDENSTFEDLLLRDGSFTIHERNIQSLAIELYKVAYGISPEIMRLTFPLKPGIKYPWEDIFQTFNVKTTSWGTQSLHHIGPKIWKAIPLEFKKLKFIKFKKTIRQWKPKCPCNICKIYIQGVGFIELARF